VGVFAVPLLASALAVGAAALPANAATWQDTSLSAFAMHADAFSGAGLDAKSDAIHGVINLSGTGVFWSLHGKVPFGVHLFGTTIGYSGIGLIGPQMIVANAMDRAGNVQALEILVVMGNHSIQVKDTSPVVKVSLSALTARNFFGNVRFSAVSSKLFDHISFAQHRLPAGLVSGDPVLTFRGGTAAPGIYHGVRVTATDLDGAVLHGVFTLVVHAQQVIKQGSWGNEVNPFGNGFDVFQQQQRPGAIIVGWTATKADPATHFLLLKGTVPGAVKFEYAPNGVATGLCVSDPGGGWKSDPLPDGLILTTSNNGPF